MVSKQVSSPLRISDADAHGRARASGWPRHPRPGVFLHAYPITIIFLCALTPIYSGGEKRWLAQETLLRIDPDAPDLGAYEFTVAAQKRKEINAITGVE
jgi:hypothetical protein